MYTSGLLASKGSYSSMQFLFSFGEEETALSCYLKKKKLKGRAVELITLALA